MPVNEFSLIRRYFSDMVFPHPAIVLGVGDDAAILQVPLGKELVFSIDTQVAGVHFPVDADAGDIAQRAFRAAISDLAAMGAEPLCFTLALSLPKPDEDWLSGFSEGLRAVARELSCSLVGGDTTSGPLCITLQVQGLCPSGSALKRSTAKPGDHIVVSGYLGNAAAYVQLMESVELTKSGNLLKPETFEPELAHASELFALAYYRPISRVDLGVALRQQASAAIDLSDGLLADLGHICQASGVSAAIHTNALPCYPELVQIFGQQRAHELALAGGDDYELCFTVAPEQLRNVIKLGEDLECPLTVIGEVMPQATQPIRLYDAAGVEQPLPAKQGYQHF